jgi:hypothetical protein
LKKFYGGQLPGINSFTRTTNCCMDLADVFEKCGRGENPRCCRVFMFTGTYEPRQYKQKYPI